MPTSRKRFQTKNMQILGYDVFVRSNNNIDAIPIVFIHGIGVSEVYFRPLAYELADQYWTMSVNLPGYGNTHRPANPLNISELAKVVAAFIKSENISKPILVGQSMGCQIVARLAVSEPDLVKKIILLSPTVNKAERSSFFQFLRLIQDSFKEPPLMTLKIIRDYFRFGSRNYLKVQRYMIKDSIEISIEKIKMSNLIVCGEKDPIVPIKWVKQLAKISPNGQMVVVQNAQHNFHYSSAKETASICSRFIQN